MGSATVTARAALAGNPSDGYGGAVTSIPVPTLAATVDVVIGPRADGLLGAAIDRFSLDVGAVPAGHTLRANTGIPRSVGLAGSSALVIAGLRALAETTGVTVSESDLIRLAYTVERTDLGIAGGWQDQVSQTVGRPVAMEFSDGVDHRALTPGRAIPFFVAWDDRSAAPSGDTHTDLRSRLDSGSAEVRALADAARRAAWAFEAGDVHELKQAMTDTLDLRFSVVPIARRHREMAEIARALGAACNFTGSGGAIIGVLPKQAEPFLRALQDHDLMTTTWEVE